jgi:hypothetical protein
MKSLRFTLTVALITFAAMCLSTSVHSMAQDTQKSMSDAQKSFDKLKTLAGGWEGPVTVDPPDPNMQMDKPIHITLRVTSRGNALVHEMQEKGAVDDPTKTDHPVTMFYLDSDRLLLTHYCDAGNRPRMVAKSSPDGKTVDFDFIDVTGDLQYGHMQHAKFTIVDANHHIEEWTFLMPGDKPMHARMELARK